MSASVWNERTAQLKFQSAQASAAWSARPSTRYKPWLQNEGYRWSVSYGQDSKGNYGVVVYGVSPKEAYEKFDKVWMESIENEVE